MTAYSVEFIISVCHYFVIFARLKELLQIMDIVLSGIRSTGKLHLGNYFGALCNFTRMQEENKCYFFIADIHSLTTHPDPKMLHQNVKTCWWTTLRQESIRKIGDLCTERCS